MDCVILLRFSLDLPYIIIQGVNIGERGGLVIEPQTRERAVGGSIHTSALLCP